MSDFVDETGVFVKAGEGGAGAVSFRREAHTPRGGPDGGDGGRGGDVWFVANRNVASLLAFRDHPHRKATSGRHGGGKGKHGPGGEDLFVPVPEGTIVRSRDGEVLADLVAHGDRWLAGEGGRGGHGNARFLSRSRPEPSACEGVWAVSVMASPCWDWAGGGQVWCYSVRERARAHGGYAAHAG